jgi:hypothetical protein
VFALAVLWSGSAEAVLIDRGGGLIYDTALNVTWLQDARYAWTSGATWPGGGMNWFEAQNWVSGLEFYDAVRGVTLTDWRLPSTISSPASEGFDTSGLSSELAFMYYVNLGYSANPSLNPGDPEPTATNYNPFTNIGYRSYWSGTGAGIADRDLAWGLHFHFGWQFINNQYDLGYAWAVRDGDVGASGASVPEPVGVGLLGLGILGLAIRRRRANTPSLS